MRKSGALLGCVAFLLAASGLAAEPVKPPLSPLAAVQTFRGGVEMRTSGQAVLVTLRGEDGDHFFKVETDLLTGLPGSFRAGAAEVLFWGGHLVVTASHEGKAWHFSVPGTGARRRPEDPPLPGKELDARLRAAYELVRIDRASAIISRSGPRALTPDPPEGLKGVFSKADTEYQDPGSGGGVGGCGRTCTISCGDGSSCSASCGENRCASCTCPALCKCS